MAGLQMRSSSYSGSPSQGPSSTSSAASFMSGASAHGSHHHSLSSSMGASSSLSSSTSSLPGQSPMPPSSPAATSNIMPLRTGLPPLSPTPIPVSEQQYRDYLIDSVLPFHPCANGIYEELLSIVIRQLCIETHKSARLGRLCLNCSHSCCDPLDESGLDIFGQPIRKTGPTVEKLMTLKCVNCQWTVAPSRYAPHLEKCMGLGRNSSRLASQRLQTITDSASPEMEVEDSDDEEYTDGGDGKKTKTPKASKKRKKKATAPMTRAELEVLLSSTCGVLSSSTGMMCTKSLNCPAHSKEQRIQVRESLLGHPGSSMGMEVEKDEGRAKGIGIEPMVYVDIEGDDEDPMAVAKRDRDD